MSEQLQELAGLLQRRLDVISDHGLRDRDPNEQLRQLQQVSEEIEAVHRELGPEIHPRLDHFLSNFSYQKALDFLSQ